MHTALIRRRRGGAAPFSPASLFANGEEGVWFEPSPTTCFTDTAGTTAAGGGDPVALLLDKSQGLVLGPEKVTNGEFDGGTTGWSAGGNASLSVVDGRLRITKTDATAFPRGTQSVSGFTVGKTYKVSGNLTRSSSFSAAINVNSRFDPWSTTTENFDYVFVSGSTTEIIGGTFNGGAGSAGFWIEIDNISAKELPGNHATQETGSAQPALNASNYLADDGGDSLNWTAPNDTYTVVRVNAAGTVTIQTGQALNGTTDIMLETNIKAYIAVNRALTSGETAMLTSYLEAT